MPNQKKYSLPLQISQRIHDLFEQNKEDLELMGVTSETRLLEVMARNGEDSVRELLGDLRRRKAAKRPVTPNKSPGE